MCLVIWFNSNRNRRRIIAKTICLYTLWRSLLYFYIGYRLRELYRNISIYFLRNSITYQQCVYDYMVDVYSWETKKRIIWQHDHEDVISTSSWSTRKRTAGLRHIYVLRCLYNITQHTHRLAFVVAINYNYVLQHCITPSRYIFTWSLSSSGKKN